MVVDGKTLDCKLLYLEETRMSRVPFFYLGSKSHHGVFRLQISIMPTQTIVIRTQTDQQRNHFSFSITTTCRIQNGLDTTPIKPFILSYCSVGIGFLLSLTYLQFGICKIAELQLLESDQTTTGFMVKESMRLHFESFTLSAMLLFPFTTTFHGQLCRIST